MSDCLFCKIVNKEIPAEIIHEDDDTLAFKDINPQAPFHALVIPKKHIVSLAEASAEDTGLLGKCLAAAAKIAADNGLDKGYRVVNNIGKHGGQTVYHIHFHILGGRRLTWPPG